MKKSHLQSLHDSQPQDLTYDQATSTSATRPEKRIHLPSMRRSEHAPDHWLDPSATTHCDQPASEPYKARKALASPCRIPCLTIEE